jgi:hypothetical protein
MGINGAATARAAVADGIEAIQHGVLEKCVVYMAACMLCLQKFDTFFRCNPPGPLWMVFDNKAGKWFTNNQTDVKG